MFIFIHPLGIEFSREHRPRAAAQCTETVSGLKFGIGWDAVLFHRREKYVQKNVVLFLDGKFLE